MRVSCLFLGVLALVAQANERDYLTRCLGYTTVAVKETTGLVSEILTKPARKGKWNCTTGGCVPYSVQMYRALPDAVKAETRIVESAGGDRITVNGTAVPTNTVHIFLTRKAANAPQESEIIIDPTYLQYVHDTGGMSVPSVFVGTREDLIRFFTTHRDRIRVRGLDGDYRGGVDPKEFVEKHYGFSRRRDETEDLLREF